MDLSRNSDFVDTLDVQPRRIADWIKRDPEMLEESGSPEHARDRELFRESRFNLQNLVSHEELDGMYPNILGSPDAGSLFSAARLQFDIDGSSHHLVEDAVGGARVNERFKRACPACTLFAGGDANERVKIYTSITTRIRPVRSMHLESQRQPAGRCFQNNRRLVADTVQLVRNVLVSRPERDELRLVVR